MAGYCSIRNAYFSAEAGYWEISLIEKKSLTTNSLSHRVSVWKKVQSMSKPHSFGGQKQTKNLSFDKISATFCTQKLFKKTVSTPYWEWILLSNVSYQCKKWWFFANNCPFEPTFAPSPRLHLLLRRGCKCILGTPQKRLRQHRLKEATAKHRFADGKR